MTIDDLHETMRLAHAYFAEIKLPIFISSSTVLGILRNNKLYDDRCIDISCIDSDYEVVKETLEKSPHYKARNMCEGKDGILYLNFHKGNDVELSIGYVQGNTIEFRPVEGWKAIYPYEPTYKTLRYNELDWNVPTNIEEHMKLMYGDTWLTDKQNSEWNWKKSKVYPNHI